LWASACLTVSGPTAGGTAWLRWLCDGASIIQATRVVSSTSYTPLPDLCWLHNPAAGAHTYTYQAAVDPNVVIISSAAGGGGFLAQEVG
jgi:hypothetical protein